MRKRETSVSTISVNKISSRPVCNYSVIFKEQQIAISIGSALHKYNILSTPNCLNMTLN